LARYGLWAQMGLLDDAIREHLELKRLTGADPGDVARDERAALGPVRRGGEAEPGDPQPENAVAANFDDSSSTTHGAAPADDPSVGQETIEINMEVELAASDTGRDSASSNPARTEPVAHPAHAQGSGGESLEWEMPSDRRVESERGEGSRGARESGSETVQGVDESVVDESVEDVLEETPDFLRDTPEQERLWFEQRPPRDFDFNE